MKNVSLWRNMPYVKKFKGFWNQSPILISRSNVTLKSFETNYMYPAFITIVTMTLDLWCCNVISQTRYVKRCKQIFATINIAIKLPKYFTADLKFFNYVEIKTLKIKNSIKQSNPLIYCWIWKIREKFDIPRGEARRLFLAEK